MKGDKNSILKVTPMILNVEDDSKIFHEAMSFKDIAFWKEVVNDEIDAILSNNTGVL